MNDVDGIRMNWDGDNLAALMRGGGFSQSSLGRAVGVSQPSVWRWINGETPSERMIRALGVALGLIDDIPAQDVSPLRALFTRDGPASVLAQSAIFQRNGNGRQ
jgi:transcriptional regulator with XRE-family HTH domain